MSKGYLTIHRKLKDWSWYKDTNTKVIFLHLILSCSYKTIKHRGIVINRGEYYGGDRALARETGLRVGAVKTAIKKLKQTNEIKLRTTHSRTLICLVNYSVYQKINNLTTHLQPTLQPTLQPIYIKKVKNKEDKEDKEKKEKKENFKKPSLEEIKDYCNEVSATIDPETFFHHYEAVGWKVGKNSMKNWRSAINGWNSREKSKVNKQLTNKSDQTIHNTWSAGQRLIKKYNNKG